MTLITAPPRPYSAEYGVVMILNSCSASTDGRATCVVNSCTFSEIELLSIPSRRKLFSSWRTPMDVKSAGAPGRGASAPIRITLALDSGDEIHQIVPTPEQQRILGDVFVIDDRAQRSVFRRQQWRGGFDGGDGRNRSHG